jgi:hypothetical protein
MLSRLLSSALLIAALSQAAAAQDSSIYNSSQPTNNGQTQSDVQNTQNLPQQLRKELTDAGFTDVKVVPSSFLVTAKSKDGQEVMIRISPGSMTMVTEVPADMTSTTGHAGNNTDVNRSNNSGADSDSMSSER